MKITIGPRSLLLEDLTNDDISALKALNDTAPSIAQAVSPALTLPSGKSYFSHQLQIRDAVNALVSQTELADGTGSALAATADTHRANFDTAAKAYT